tara:strand:- start:2884 stop:3585 length:702 start_codon:yes stop_codon:yes gene_type:complete
LVQNRYTLLEHVGDPIDWHYTWQLRDDVTLSSTCGFCGRSELRLTYEVTRQLQTVWICESCVSRYNISADIDGQALGPRAARDYAHGLTARLKQQTCQDIIRHVQTLILDTDLEEAAVYFDRNLQLSPQRAARLFSALRQIGDECKARVFEVQTRSNLHQQEFGELSDEDRSLVWVALSQQQRRRLASLGFAPAGAVVRRGAAGRPGRVAIHLSTPRMPALTPVASVDPKRKR